MPNCEGALFAKILRAIQVRRFSKFRGSSRVGSSDVRNLTSRFGAGRQPFVLNISRIGSGQGHEGCPDA